MDVVINIAHQLTPITRKEFNTPLLLVEETSGGEPVQEYKVYSELEQVSADYGTDSVAYKMAAAILSQRIRPSQIAIYNMGTRTGDPTELSTALDEILNAGNTGWYFLIPATRVDADRLELANWVETQRRMLVIGNGDSEDVSSFVTSVGGLPDSDRVVACYHPTNEADGNYLEAALVGWIAGRYAGAAAWFHAKLSGLTESTCTYNEIQSLETANVITWWKTPVGIWVTTCGKTIGGEWADITQVMDFVEARLKERIWSLLVDKDRIPYTQEGINLLANAVEAELHRLARSPYNIIATNINGRPLCRVIPPLREEIDSLEVRNRRIPDLPFEATVAGAVKQITVNGILTEEIVEPYPVTG